jgi:hypothetical protein
MFVARAAKIGVRYTDNLDRADGVLGSNWVYTNTNVSPRISSNQAAFTDSTDGFRGALWVNPATTDAMFVTMTTKTALTSAPGALILRSNSGMTSWVGAFFGTGGVGIYTFTGPGGAGQTTRASTSTNPNIASGSVVKFSAIGNTYTLYDDGAQLVQWVDSSNAWTNVGSSYRYGGFGLQRASFTNSAPMDDFVFQDNSYV